MRYVMICILSLTMIACAMASQIEPRPELDIEGLIAVVEWVPERTEKGEPGMSGSLGCDRTFPAHYAVELVDCTVTLAEGESESSAGSMSKPKLGKTEKYSLTLNYPADDGYFKRGMRVNIKGYKVSGDEGGIWTSYRSASKTEAPLCPCQQNAQPVNESEADDSSTED